MSEVEPINYKKTILIKQKRKKWDKVQVHLSMDGFMAFARKVGRKITIIIIIIILVLVGNSPLSR